MAPLGIAFNCKRFSVEALPPDWVLPPGRRQAGPTGEAGPAPGQSSTYQLDSSGPRISNRWPGSGRVVVRPVPAVNVSDPRNLPVN